MGAREKETRDRLRPLLLLLATLPVIAGACSRPAASDAVAASASASARPLAASARPLAASSDAELVARPSLRAFTDNDTALSADFSLDRRFVAIAERSGRAVLVLDRASFAERARIPTPKPAGPVAFSADGNRLAVALDGSVSVYETRGGAQVRASISRGARAVALSRDGSMLATGDGGGRVALWRTDTGELLADAPLESLIRELHFTPDDRAVLAMNNQLFYLDLPALTTRWHVAAPYQTPIFLRGGERIVAGCGESTICVYGAADGRELRKLTGTDGFAASDDRSVVYRVGPEVVFQDVETGAVARRAPLPPRSGRLHAMSAGDRRITFVDTGLDAVFEWDLDARAYTGSYLGLPERVGAVAFADDAHLVVATESGLTTTLDLDGRPPSAPAAHGGGTADTTALLRHGTVLARARDERVEMWDAGATAPRASVGFPPGTRRIRIVAAADGSSVLADSATRLTIWDPDAAARPVTAALPPVFEGLALAPHAAQAAITEGGKLLLVDPAASTARALPEPRAKLFERAAFSPDGARLAVSAWDARDAFIGIYTVADGAREWATPGERHVTALVFSPGGRFLAAASDKGRVSLWDASSGVLAGTFPAHDARIEALAFSPDGRLLASGATDGTVTVTRVKPFEVALRYTPLRSSGQTCALSPDGRAECFGAGSDEGLVCRAYGRPVPLERCAARRKVGLAAVR